MLIKDVQARLFRDGFLISADNIRRLEKKGIVFSTRDEDNDYRVFSQEQFDRSIKNVKLYQLGMPITEIIKADPVYIAEWTKKVINTAKRII